jgi:hypothetical protein
MDIASVIVTSMVTCRVLARFTLDNRSEQRFPVAQFCFLVTPLEATLPRFSASVHSKRLTARLSPLEATLTKKPGALFTPSVFGEGPPVVPRARSAGDTRLPERSRRTTIFSRLPVVAPVVVPSEPRCFSTGNAIYLFSLYIVIRLFPFKRGGVHPHPPPCCMLSSDFRCWASFAPGDRP